MDFNALVRFIFLEKNDLTFGVLIGLTLIVVILLLVRSVVDEKESAASGGGAVDSKTITTAIEGALKKAIATGAIGAGGVSSGSAEGASSSGPDGSGKGSPETAELKKVLSDREAKIASLLSDLEVLKSQADAGAASSSKSSGASGGAETEALLAKINELQAKLSEYEIIEDDIADLSTYKEENKKLKDEIEKLRVATTTARDQVQATQQAVSEPAATVDVQAAQAAVLDVKPSLAETETVVPATKAAEPPAAPKKAAEPFVLDTADDVMGEFAKALSQSSAQPAPASEISAVDEFANLVVSGTATVDPQAAIDALLANTPAPTVATEPSAPEEAQSPSDPFGALDTEKMLAEVASMSDSGGDTSGGSDTASVLDEQLDTDRLMAEMGIAESPAAPVETSVPAAAAAPSEPVAATPPAVTSAPAPTVASAPAPSVTSVQAPSVTMAPSASASQVPVDDLLAEFNDTDFQAKKDSKG